VAIVGLVVHELGHGSTAQFLGGTFRGLYVWPGIQIWPSFGEQFQGEWQGFVGVVSYSYGEDWLQDGWQVGLVQLMGSGANLILAILSLSALWAIRPRKWIRLFLLAEAFVFTDMLFYTFLPLIGLRHWFFFGGDSAEPLLGATKLGIQTWLFLLLVVIVSGLMIKSIFIFHRKYPFDS